MYVLVASDDEIWSNARESPSLFLVDTCGIFMRQQEGTGPNLVLSAMFGALENRLSIRTISFGSRLDAFTMAALVE